MKHANSDRKKSAPQGVWKMSSAEADKMRERVIRYRKTWNDGLRAAGIKHVSRNMLAELKIRYPAYVRKDIVSVRMLYHGKIRFL
ncbi:MAG: hypothetical protein U9O97_07045, partial [Elusimicrobiota bacterium]|nr:hypothetical protein [Elusimicrobiota bacterium]